MADDQSSTGNVFGEESATSSPIVIQGTGGNDTIVVSESNNILTATVNGTITYRKAITKNHPVLQVNGLAGNDTITLQNIGSPFQQATVDAGPGNDAVTAAEHDDAAASGRRRRQRYAHRRPGPQYPAWAATATTTSAPACAPNDVFGDAGNDSVDYAARTHGFEIHLDGNRDSGMSGEHDLISTDVENVYGSQGNDIIFGTVAGERAHSTAWAATTRSTPATPPPPSTAATETTSSTPATTSPTTSTAETAPTRPTSIRWTKPWRWKNSCREHWQ